MPKLCCSVVVLWCCFFTGATKQGKNPASMYCTTAMATATRTAKKAIGLDQQKNVFHVHHPFVYIFFANCYISHFVVDVNTSQLFPNSFFKLTIQSFRIQLQKKITSIWQIERHRLSAMKALYSLCHTLIDHRCFTQKFEIINCWAGDEGLLLIEATVGYSIRRIGNCRLRKKIVTNTEI